MSGPNVGTILRQSIYNGAMPKIPEPTPILNRLRAASALPALIESGLRDSKLAKERAALMAEFCLWAQETAPKDDPVAAGLVREIEDGLVRVRALLETVPG